MLLDLNLATELLFKWQQFHGKQSPGTEGIKHLASLSVEINVWQL
jgi:hypothetical protein